MPLNMSLKLIDVVIYIIILVIIWLILTREVSDLTCDAEGSLTCNNGTSMALAPGAPEVGDDMATLLQKIAFTARYEHNTVVWRRAFVSASAISFISLFVVLKRVPQALEFLAGLLISFAVLYTMILIYQPLTSDKAVLQIDKLLEHVNELN